MRRHWAWALLVSAALMAGCVPISAPTPPASVTGIPTVTPEVSSVDPNLLETRAASDSPDGQWHAHSVAAFPADGEEYYQRLTVTRYDGQGAWTPVESWSRMGLGYTVAVPFAWSSQADALYFTHLPNPDGCALFVNGWSLQRLSLTDGKVSEIVPGTGLALAISPTERHVAEIVDGPPVLLIHDLAARSTLTVTLPGTDATVQAGSLVWSPDGAQVALALAHDPCVGGWARATSLLAVDLTTQTTRLLLAEDDRLLRPIAWPEASGLIVEDKGGDQLALDPESGEVTQHP